jgi:RNA polymerase sigma factor (sigma-70 family)
MGEREHGELVRAVGSGDRSAWAELYRIYLPLVLRWCLHATKDRELAADLSSEVFAAAALAARRYRPESAPVGAWLIGIAQHKLGDSLRRRRVEDSARRKIGIDPVALTDADLERVDELVGMNDRLQALLAELPEQYRAAVVARVIDERSYDDIAVELDCSPSVVRQRVSRGLRTLRSGMCEQ